MISWGFPNASQQTMRQLYFICSISNSTNKEEKLWQLVLILHQEFYRFEDYSNGWSIFTFLSMLKLFKHAFMHRFVSLLGTVHTEQSKHNVPKLLVWGLCHVANPDWKSIHLKFFSNQLKFQIDGELSLSHNCNKITAFHIAAYNKSSRSGTIPDYSP